MGKVLRPVRCLLTGRVEAPGLEAELLLGKVLSCSRLDLLRRDDELLAPALVAEVERLARRRHGREPLAYVLGEWEFYGRSFAVGPGVLVPRPETEHVVEQVLRRVTRGWLAEVGVGSAALSLSVLLEHSEPTLRVLGIDRETDALTFACRNRRRWQLQDRLLLGQGDLLAGCRPRPIFCGVVANLPYVEPHEYERLPPEVRLFEPPPALTPRGESPAELRQRLLLQARDRILPGGFVALEVGAGQAGRVRDEMLSAGYRQIEIHNDLALIGRVVVGTWPARRGRVRS